MKITKEQFKELAKKHLFTLEGYDINRTIEIFGVEKLYDEVIKPKPLFVTEDGVECFDRDEYITIGYDFNKRNMVAYNYYAPYPTDVIRFKHESNADEYIAWHKKEFSINDLLLADVGITTSQLDKLQELAKKKKKRVK